MICSRKQEQKVSTWNGLVATGVQHSHEVNGKWRIENMQKEINLIDFSKKKMLYFKTESTIKKSAVSEVLDQINSFYSPGSQRVLPEKLF